MDGFFYGLKLVINSPVTNVDNTQANTSESAHITPTGGPWQHCCDIYWAPHQSVIITPYSDGNKTTVRYIFPTLQFISANGNFCCALEKHDVR
jgi:hypothetical protein